MSPGSSDNDVRAEAVDWFVLLDGGRASEDDRARHRAWLAARSEHRDAYASVSQTFSVAQMAQAQMAQTMSSAPASARGMERFAHATRAFGRPQWALLAAGAAILAVLLGVRQFRPDLLATRYTTGIGEHRDLALADGSIVHLNAATTLSVRFTDEARDIDLRQGEALFEVAHDPSHPFRVHAATRTIQAVGTAFDVDRQGTAVEVAVSEGTVIVSAPRITAPNPAIHASDTSATVSKGYAVSYSADQALGEQRAITSELVGSWQHGVLYYEDVPLAQLAGDLDRQFGTVTRIDDPKLAAMSITISLKLHDREATLGTLAKLLPIRIRRTSANSLVFEAAH
jgi:transmembrane sensor